MRLVTWRLETLLEPCKASLFRMKVEGRSYVPKVGKMMALKSLRWSMRRWRSLGLPNLATLVTLVLVRFNVENFDKALVTLA